KKKALSIGTVRIKHFLAQKLALGTLWGGGRSSPPQIFQIPNFFQKFSSAIARQIKTVPF
ncbi:hypothetical protein KEK95_00005, partial [Enterococcus faecium]|nr:hypothetical protein [Enterococcus faecium]MCH0416633.1 hypothetical protein [Enterococcus faecium]MCH0419473.1 hypothetical protein [Enterococcus faecium]